MGHLTPIAQSFSNSQLQIIKNTCAPDTNNDEFNLFIEAAKAYQLNPMKRQIMAMVFSKDKPDKRRMSLIVEIGGMRSIAARSGKYRPASEPTVFECLDELKSSTNPHGILRATITLHIQDDTGEWFPVIGEAWWDEHAVIEDEWAWNDAKGKRAPTGNLTLGKTWEKMPYLMIAKCAEAQALRKGWPEEVGGLYEQAEGDTFDADMTPTEAVERANAEGRSHMIGRAKDEYALQFSPGGIIEMVPSGQVHSRIDKHIDELETSLEVKDFKARNSQSLKRFWADHKSDALELNRVIEARINTLSASDNEQVLA